MDIHEYQAKRLLYSYGAPVASGVAVYSVEQAREWVPKLSGPLYVVKSQIHAGGRGKGHFKSLGEEPTSENTQAVPSKGAALGGVRLAHSVEEAVAHVQDILGKTLVTKQTGPKGKLVQRVYIEEGAQIEKEFYVSLLLDRKVGRLSFVVSAEGGMDIEEVAKTQPDKIFTLVVDPHKGVGKKEATQLCEALNLEDTAKKEGMKLFPLLYKVFTEKDATLLEINPLALLKDGHLRIVDSKMSFDKSALARHPDILALRDLTEEDPKEVEASKYGLSYVALDGEIGCMVNGAGLAMATMDIIKLYGKSPANFLDVGGGSNKEKVTAAFKILLSDPHVKGILVNIFGGIVRCDVIAEGILEALGDTPLDRPLVVRLEGTKVEEGKRLIEQSNVPVIFSSDLDDAAQKIVAAVGGQ